MQNYVLDAFVAHSVSRAIILRMAHYSRNSIGRFEQLEEIGSGAYSKVFRAFDSDAKAWIAMKRIHLGPDGIPTTLIREVGLLKKLRSQFIIDIKDVVVVAPEYIYLVLEYLDIDLRRLISNFPESVTKDFARRAIKQILCGLEYCHSRRVMHRDLKPENILLTTDFRVKIADFGLARLFQVPLRPLSETVQTLHYRAPEVLLGCKEYTPAVDMWSVGCIFVELLTHKRLFEGYSDLSQLVEISRLLGPPPLTLCTADVQARLQVSSRRSLQSLLGQCSEDCKDLIERMLKYDPSERISAREALRHPFFEDVDSES